jgi:hypothetical protein
MQFYWLALGVLAVWRITHLLFGEDGPGNILVKLRQRFGSSLAGQVLDCFYCLSVWIALPFALVIGADWKERLLLWPALSGGAILLERSTGSARTPSVPYFEAEEEQDHGLLRRRETTGEAGDGGAAGSGAPAGEGSSTAPTRGDGRQSDF